MKLMHIHAHFDDFEFYAAGTFELMRQKHGDDFQAKVVVCTDGQAGHHALSRPETGKRRMEEQQASSEIGAYNWECLRSASGTHFREGCLQADREFLAALWHCIREYQPDYLFCPQLATDPLSGIHIDHETVAEAVRKIAYMINVPHCFIDEYPGGRGLPKPVLRRNPRDHQLCRQLSAIQHGFRFRPRRQ